MNKKKYSTGQLLNFVEDSYLERTSRPIYGVVFLLPFIIFYELGTILINTDVLNQSQVRVVAFVWLQNLLEYLGFGSKLAWAAPAFAVVIILLSLQAVSHKQWRFWFGDIWPMFVECILLAVPLIVLSLFLSSSTQRQDNTDRFADWGARLRGATHLVYDSRFEVLDAQPDKAVSSCSAVTEHNSDGRPMIRVLADIVTGIGAGIYEELVFRLILICVLMLLFQDALRLSRKSSIILSVLVSAALFSAHHHIVYLDGRLVSNASFSWAQFSFRTIAGAYFAVLFAVRGFAVTAGTHAFYDTIAVLINAVFFQQ
jgi:membrane protease YdiL (CAAX protease family)